MKPLLLWMPTLPPVVRKHPPGGNAPPPPAYMETPIMKKVDKGAGPAKLSDNYANSMAQEDIRLNDRDIGCKFKVHVH